MKYRPRHLRIRFAILSAVALVLQFFGPLIQDANAAGILTSVQVVFDRMAQSTATTGTVCAKEATTSALVRKTILTFPTGFTVSTTAGNWTTDTTSNNKWPAGASAWPGITTATATISGQAVTWTATADQSMTAATTYCYNWTNSAALTQPGSPAGSEGGSLATQTNGAVAIDSGNFATATIANDQVVISAIVPQTFTFSLSANTDSFTTNLSTSSVSHTTGINANVSTNAINGWIIWAREANATCPGANCGLKSPTANYTIGWTNVASNTTISGDGNEHYITGAIVTTAGNGAPATATTVVPTTAYNGGANTSAARGAGLDNTLRQAATANGTTSGSVVQFYESAAVNAATPAATDYSDTVTIVAAASF